MQCDQRQRNQDLGRDGDEGGGGLSVISTEKGGDVKSCYFFGNENCEYSI